MLPLRANANATLQAFSAAGLLGGGDSESADNASDADNSLYYWIGLGIVVGSAILSNLGVNVQKLSHVRVRPGSQTLSLLAPLRLSPLTDNGAVVLRLVTRVYVRLRGQQEEERPPFARRMYYTRPIWIIGMILIVLGAIGDFEALGCVVVCFALMNHMSVAASRG